MQNAAKAPIKRAVVGVGVSVSAGRFQKHHTEQRCHGNGGHPAQQQRDHDNGVQRARVLTGRVLRGTDRGEGEYCNDGCAQQRPRRLRDDIQRGLAPVHSLLEADQHAVDNDDRVIDQHAERDNQSAQRYTLQRDILQAHENETAANGQKEDEPDQQAAAQTHEKQQHDDNDGDCLQQAGDESLNCRLHGVRLHRDKTKLHTKRNFAGEFLHFRLQFFAHFDDVAAGGGRDADTDGSRRR